MNIKFRYLYRDGANYKNYNEVIFSNPNGISLEIIENIIRECLIDGVWFVATKWNLPDMHFKEYSWDSDIDHDWHEFEYLEQTLDSVTEKFSVEDFLNQILQRKDLSPTVK